MLVWKQRFQAKFCWFGYRSCGFWIAYYQYVFFFQCYIIWYFQLAVGFLSVLVLQNGLWQSRQYIFWSYLCLLWSIFSNEHFFWMSYLNFCGHLALRFLYLRNWSYFGVRKSFLLISWMKLLYLWFNLQMQWWDMDAYYYAQHLHKLSCQGNCLRAQWSFVNWETQQAIIILRNKMHWRAWVAYGDNLSQIRDM